MLLAPNQQIGVIALIPLLGESYFWAAITVLIHEYLLQAVHPPLRDIRNELFVLNLCGFLVDFAKSLLEEL